MFWCCVFCVVAAARTAGAAHLFYAEEPKVTELYSKAAHLKFKSNFSSQTKYKFITFWIAVGGDTIANGGKTSINSEKDTIFGNRLTAVPTSAFEYSLFVSNLKYEDNVVFVANCLVMDNTGTSIVKSNITLQVIGGPHLCAGDLPSITVVNTTENKHIEVVVCGNPKPTVAWGNGNVSLSGTSELLDGFKGRYKYNVALPRISPSMCGNEITFVANGQNGIPQKGKTKLDVVFEPSTSIITSYQVNSSCIKVVWKPVDIGACAGLIYNIEYLNDNSSTITTSNSTHPALESIHCSGLVTNINFTRIRASFNGQVGSWSGKNNVLLSDPYVEIMYTERSTGSEEDDEWKAIVGGVVGGFFFLLFLILIIYCCCCSGCCAAYCGCCVCSACCGKKEKEEKFGVVKTNSLSFQYKKNSKKKKSVKVDLKNKENNNSTSNNTFAPVVIADDNQPAVIYAHAEKNQNQNSDDMKYFDPNEFDMETETPVTLKSNYTNSTYDYGDDKDTENKPSFLI